MSPTARQPDVPAHAASALPSVAVSSSSEEQQADPLNRQRALVAIGRRVIAPPEQSILMQDAAALLAEMLDTEYHGVAEVSPDGKSLRLELAQGEGDAARSPAAVHETSADGADSLAAFALQTAHPVAASDLPQDERFDDALLRKHGIKSAVAVPLRLSDRTFGALIACSTEGRRFDDEDVMFAETIGHLVASTVARKQSEQSLADQHRFADEVLRTVDALVLVLDNQWRVVRINSACERVTGFSPADIKGRAVCDALSIPKEVAMFQHALEQLQQKTSPVEFEGHVLTKHGDTRLIAWSLSAVAAGNGTLESVIATGVDITEQREAQQRAAEAEEAAEQLRQEIAEWGAVGDGESGQEGVGPRSGQSPADDGQDPSAFAPLPDPTGGERRKLPRRRYPYTQKIGFVVDGRLPEQPDFLEVKCHDISAGGFSFLWSKPPVSDTLVAALGVTPKVTYLTAQVAHVTRTEKNGRRMFLIGCNYVARTHY